MTRHRITYRKKTQNRFSMFLVSLVVVMILILVSVSSIGLRAKIPERRSQLYQLELQLESEKRRQVEIEEYGKEVQTKGFIESVAREKLGLVYEGEVVFKQRN